MKNIPNTIFLNLGEDLEDFEDFNELGEVTWCVDKIGDGDIEYQRKPIWHYLKKNPNDLPKTNKDVMVMIRRAKYQEITVKACYDLSQWIYQNWSNDVVLAWMDIPKFKY